MSTEYLITYKLVVCVAAKYTKKKTNARVTVSADATVRTRILGQWLDGKSNDSFFHPKCQVSSSFNFQRLIQIALWQSPWQMEKRIQSSITLIAFGSGYWLLPVGVPNPSFCIYNIDFDVVGVNKF